MKRLFFLCITASLFASNAFTQPLDPIPSIDKSPMDMSTYPPEYPMLKIQDKATEPLLARVVYSRPQKNGRVIFGELLTYNEVWRFGANENTEIEFFKDVRINNFLVKKGKYSLYAIPNVDKWTIILNKDLNTWGSFKYQASKDLLRVNLPLKKMKEISETFFIYFEKSGKGFNMIAGWDEVEISLPISI